MALLGHCPTGISCISTQRKEQTMHHYKRSLLAWLALACLLLSAGLALSGLGSPAGAAYYAAPRQPATNPRLHHLSGVVAIPPSQVQAEARAQAMGSDLGYNLKRLLIPPVFGPNV